MFNIQNPYSFLILCCPLRAPQNVPTLEFKERNISAFYDFKCQVIVFPVMYVSLIVIARYHKPRMEEDHFRIADGKRHAL